MSEIKANPLKKRREDKDQVEVLSESITNVGLINPLIVYKKNEGEYVLIDGHIRLCALSKTDTVSKDQIPCIVVDEPFDKIKELELMANVNMHRNKPENLKQEIEIANVFRDTMDSNRRKILSEEFKDKFIEKYCGEEKYQEAFVQCISNGFRPRFDYIRTITGLDYSNKDMLDDILNSKQEQFCASEEQKTEESKQLTTNDLIKCIQTLKRMLIAYQKETMQDRIVRIIEILTIFENDIRDKK